MMKFHKPGRLRMYGGGAAIAMLGGLSLALGSAGAVAQPAPPTPPAPPSSADGRHDNTRVIVRTIRSEEHRDHQGGDARSERRGGAEGGERRQERHVTIVTRDGRDGGGTIDVDGPEGHRVMAMRDCEGAGANRTEVNEGTENNRTRIILCNSGSEQRTPAQQADALQRARERLAGDSHIPAEHRDRVLASIDREIARLRAQR